MNDARFALRQMARAPGFTLLAMGTIAVGIGASAAMFSVVNGVLLRPPPISDVDRLVTVRESFPPTWPDAFVSAGKFLRWRQQARSFESIGALSGMSYNLTGVGAPDHLYAARVTASLFPTMKLQPVLGRGFLPEEDRPYLQENVAILSHGLWQRAFGGREDVLGRTIQLNGRPFTVVGVLPADTALPERIEIFTPLGFREGAWRFWSPDYQVVGRLRPGVDAADAQAELESIGASIAREYPETRGWVVKVTPFMDALLGNARPVLLVLLAAVGFLLLVACANVANLLLARATARHRELAVRAAVGASRARLGRQLLVESLLLSAGGGALGVLVAWAGLQALLALAPEALPRAAIIGIDGRVLGFTLVLVMLTGLGFGLLPVLRASPVRLHEALRQSARGAGEAREGQRTRSLLVVAEVSLAVMLLAGAGLLMRSFSRLVEVNPGFDAAGAHVANIFLPYPKYQQGDDQVTFAERSVAEIAALPGVTAVGVAANIPFSQVHLTDFSAVGQRFRLPGTVADLPPDQRPVAHWYRVGAGYFQAMGIPLLRGRGFDARDQRPARRVAIVSQSFVRRFVPDGEPLGKLVNLDWPTPLEIVGVVGDVKPRALDGDTGVQIYGSFAQFPDNDIVYVVRGADGSPTALATLGLAVRRAIARVDGEVPTYDDRPLDALVGRSLARQRFAMTLFLVFSGVALLLAAIGLYGVIAFSVVRRTAEIGIRVALGARAGDVLRLVMGQGARLVALGLLVGLAGAALLSSLLDRLLFEVSAHDPLTFLAVVPVLVTVGALACLIPAGRALRVEPMRALRID